MIKLLILCLFMLPIAGLAQEGGMVSWKFSARKISADVFELSAKATIASGWHIYNQDSGEGSMPTLFTFDKNAAFVLEGKVLEIGALKKSRNEVMNSELKFYEDSVSFVQKVKVKKEVASSLRSLAMTGRIEFMVCNDQMCLPPEEVAFKVELK